MTDWNRVVVKHSVYDTTNLLRVEAGAVGTIRGSDAGDVTIIFDDAQQRYIRRDGGGRLIQQIPRISTRALALLAGSDDSPLVDRIESDPTIELLSVEEKREMVWNKEAERDYFQEELQSATNDDAFPYRAKDIRARIEFLEQFTTELSALASRP